MTALVNPRKWNVMKTKKWMGSTGKKTNKTIGKNVKRKAPEYHSP
jgi:hypothetical protein